MSIAERWSRTPTGPYVPEKRISISGSRFLSSAVERWSCIRAYLGDIGEETKGRWFKSARKQFCPFWGHFRYVCSYSASTPQFYEGKVLQTLGRLTKNQLL